jgi:hypothetical protein
MAPTTTPEGAGRLLVVGRARTARVSCVLALITIVATAWLRSPTWNDHILFIDEPIYYSMATRLDLPGARLYTHTSEQKPPLGTLTYWIAEKISPRHAITVVHIFTTLSIAATALLLLVVSHTVLGCPWAGFWAGLLYLMIVSGSEINPLGTAMLFAFSGMEHFQTPWLVGFFLLYFLSLGRQSQFLAASAGAALGMAALYKQNVPALLAPVWLTVGLGAWRGDLNGWRAASLGALVTATTLAIFGAVPVYYAAVGHFAEWRLYNVDLLALYSESGATLGERARFLAACIPLPVFVGAGLLYGALGVFRRDRSDQTADLRLLLAIGCVTLFASVVPGQRKAHYLIQALPLACLLIGLLAVASWRIARRSRNWRVAAAALYVVVFLLPLGVQGSGLYRSWGGLVNFAGRDAFLDIHRWRGTLTPIVNYIQAHSTPDDPIYVHGALPEFYWLTRRRPAVSDFGIGWARTGAADTRFLADLYTTPPRFIIQLDYRRYFNPVALETWPSLCAWVYQHYRERPLVEHVQLLEWLEPITRATAEPEGLQISLSSLPPTGCTQAVGWFRFDRSANGGPMRIGDRTYSRGVGTNAPSQISYRLDGGYDSFAAEVGIDAAAGQKGSVIFEVEVDGATKFTSGFMRGDQPPAPVLVDISGAHELVLRVGPTTDGPDYDYADWGEPRLIRANAMVSVGNDYGADGNGDHPPQRPSSEEEAGQNKVVE